MKHKLFLVLSVLLALAVLLTACATPTPPPPVKETVEVPVPVTQEVQVTVEVPVPVTVTPPPKVEAQPDTLVSAPVKVAPVLDGNGDDAAWQEAPATALDVLTFGTDSFQITLKSVYDAENVYFLLQYPDANMEAARGPWVFNPQKKAWEVVADDFGDEDEFGFFWNNNVPNYEKVGCGGLCHGTTMVAPKGTWVDEWQFLSVRTNPMGWARDFRLTDDETADPSGGFVKDEGFATNKGYAANTQTIGKVDVPLYWKPFSGAGGISIGDPNVLLQSEIDAGVAKKIVSVDKNGNLTDESGNQVPAFVHIPGWILSAPAGPSWNDIKAKGAWLDGVWTVEIARKLNTGHSDDVQFEVGQEYYFDMYIKTRLPGESAHAQVKVTKFVFAK